MSFLLGILGLGKFIKEFFLQNWKIILPIILVVIIGFTAKHWYDVKITEAYNNGVQIERAAWNKRVNEENKKNQTFQNNLQLAINNFGKKTQLEDDNRVAKEIIKTNEIIKIVESEPKYKDCVVDPEVISRRNQIRKLGEQ